METEMYNVIGSEEELHWFFDHAMFPLSLTESYLFVMCSRHKKLTKEERETLGLTRKSAEFLRTEVLRRPKFKTNGTDPEKAESLSENITFAGFLRTIAKFNVDKRAYVTDFGLPIPDGTLSVLCYVNPCDDLKAWDEVSSKVDGVKTGLMRAALPAFGGGNVDPGVLGAYQTFGNVAEMLKHAKAHCKGSVYWLDYDFDVCPDFKKDKYRELHDYFASKVGIGNFIVVDTSGGYHILIRTFTIRWNPHDVCKDLLAMAEGYANEKTECIVNDSQIPGIPLPGTLQYGRLVTVANKEDFE